MKYQGLATLLFILYIPSVTSMWGTSLWGGSSIVSQLTESTSDFSQRLYQQVAIGKENVVYSPYSIHSALTMTSAGARGSTLIEMRNVLGITSLGDIVSTAYHGLILQLNSAEYVKVNTANALFVKPTLQLDSVFVRKATQNYLATVTRFDLNAPGGPEKVINDFVARKTEDMIKNIVDPGSIDTNTEMLLLNTMFFNGTWQTPFEEYRTKKQDFHQLGGVKKQVDMMNNDLWLPYKQDFTLKADVLDMPYKGGRFSLVIVLPHDREGIADIEKTVTTTTGGFDDIFENLRQTYITIGIPKFKVETKLSLASTLKAMGMKMAFNPSVADFSGISYPGAFYLDKVIHQAVIDVKESGTVAAAATLVTWNRASGYFESPKFSFIADHPFLFFLRDSQTGQVLFQGKFSA